MPFLILQVERSTGLELPLPISGGSLKLLEPTSNSCPPSECRGEANSAPYFSSVASDQTVSASRGSRVHLSDPKQNFDHHQMMAEQVQKMEETMTSIREDRNSMSEEAVKQLQVWCVCVCGGGGGGGGEGMDFGWRGEGSRGRGGREEGGGVGERVS